MKHLLLTTIAAVVLVGTVFADPLGDAGFTTPNQSTAELSSGSGYAVHEGKTNQ